MKLTHILTIIFGFWVSSTGLGEEPNDPDIRPDPGSFGLAQQPELSFTRSIVSGEPVLLVGLMAGKDGAAIKIEDLFDPASSVEVYRIKEGKRKLLPLLAGGRAPGGAASYIGLPPNVRIDLVVPIPNSDSIMKGEPGEYIFRLARIKSKELSFIVKDGKLIILGVPPI